MVKKHLSKIELLEWRRNLAEQIVSQVWLPFASESMESVSIEEDDEGGIV
jgi:hypothetical protein